MLASQRSATLMLAIVSALLVLLALAVPTALAQSAPQFALYTDEATCAASAPPTSTDPCQPILGTSAYGILSCDGDVYVNVYSSLDACLATDISGLNSWVRPVPGSFNVDPATNQVSAVCAPATMTPMSGDSTNVTMSFTCTPAPYNPSPSWNRKPRVLSVHALIVVGASFVFLFGLVCICARHLRRSAARRDALAAANAPSSSASSSASSSSAAYPGSVPVAPVVNPPAHLVVSHSQPQSLSSPLLGSGSSSSSSSDSGSHYVVLSDSSNVYQHVQPMQQQQQQQHVMQYVQVQQPMQQQQPRAMTYAYVPVGGASINGAGFAPVASAPAYTPYAAYPTFTSAYPTVQPHHQ